MGIFNDLATCPYYTQLQACFNAGSTPITLTANITLGVFTLTIPNAPVFARYIGTFDITGSGWAIMGNPTINASVNATSTETFGFVAAKGKGNYAFTK